MIESTVGLVFILIVLLLCLSHIEDRNKLRAKPFFRWYDLWIGAYIDRDNQAVYICPIPMFGIKFSWHSAPKPNR